MAIYQIEGRLVSEQEFWQNNTGGISFITFESTPKKQTRENIEKIIREAEAECKKGIYPKGYWDTFEYDYDVRKLIETQERVYPQKEESKKGMSTRHKAGDSNPLEELKNSRVHSKTEEQIHEQLDISKEDIDNLNIRSLYNGVNGQIFTPVDSFKTEEDENINSEIKPCPLVNKGKVTYWGGIGIQPLTVDDNGDFVKEADLGVKQSEGKLFYEFDWEFIEAAAKRMQENKGDKYPHWNWKKPIEIESLKQAINRHHIEVMKSNYRDGEDPLGHVVSYMCNAMMLWHQLKNRNESQQDYSKIFAQ